MPSSYTLGKHFESFVQTKLASGRYGNASEVLRDALRLMEDREQYLETRTDLQTHDAWFRAMVQEALDDPQPAIADEKVSAHFAERRGSAEARIKSI